MSKVIMYTTGFCPYCLRAESLLTSKGVAEIEKIRIDLEPEQREKMMKKLVVVQSLKYILGKRMLVVMMTWRCLIVKVS